MDREKQLQQIANEYLKTKCNLMNRYTREYYYKHEKEILDHLACKFGEAMEKCKKVNKNIQYIVFSVLESSIHTKKYDLQIALYDERMYLDDMAIYTYWLPEFIFQQIEDDMLGYKKMAARTILRIKDQEIESIRKQYVMNHYFQVLLLLRIMLPKLIDQWNDCTAGLNHCTFLFGKYMERPILLYETKN